MIERGPRFMEFWNRRYSQNENRLLLIAGLGFDPRATQVLRALIESRPACTLDVRLLHYDEGPDSVSQQYAAAVAGNRQMFEQLIREHGGALQNVIVPVVEDNRRVGGRRIGALAVAAGFHGYADVMVDISALPRTLYFPLLRYLLQLSDKRHLAGSEEGTAPANLHVGLFEAPALDAQIFEELTERAEYIAGFGGTVDLQQDEDMPRVWAPVLGEGQIEALKLIEQKISILENAPEICPVLPFPAVNPRRGDQLLVEYRSLFDSWRVDLRNIIYASEHNPFDVYRQLCRLHDQYSRALGPLRGAKMIVSAHSSKLLSLGALLAAYDRPEIAVAHVEAQGYHVGADLAAPLDGELCSIWIAGEPYDA